MFAILGCSCEVTIWIVLFLGVGTLFAVLFLPAGFAGLVSSVVFHPVDSYKAHAQFQLKVCQPIQIN
jgi:hypothetical protein